MQSKIATNGRSQRNGSLAKPLTIITLCYIAFTFAAPLSSSVYTEYLYNYEANYALGPTGARVKAKASLEILYVDANSEPADDTSFLVRLRLIEPTFYPGSDSGSSQPLVISHKHNSLYNVDHDLYAHITTKSNGTAYIKQLYTHQADAPTFKNMKKAILLNLLPTSHHLDSKKQKLSINIIDTNSQLSLEPICTDDNNEQQPELFSPDSISQVSIFATVKNSRTDSSTSSNSIDNLPNGPIIFESVQGYQNVTFRSRVLSIAASNLSTTFRLNLINEVKSSAHEIFDQAVSLGSALKLIDTSNYQADTVELERERQICSSHHCGRTLSQLFSDYKESLIDESLASVEAAVSSLRLISRVRESKGTSVTEIMSILKSTRNNQGLESSFLDILAGARTKDSISAALKYLRLPKCQKLDSAERFLSALSVAAKTAAKMHLNRPLQSPYYYSKTPHLKLSKQARDDQARLASLEYIAREFLSLLEQTPSNKWASHKLHWSSLLTLATLVSAYNQEKHYETINDDLNKRVTKLLLEELNICPDTDCRIVALQAIGNLGLFGDAQYKALTDQALNSGRRESISAMNVLRDILQNQPKDKPLSQDFYTSLEELLTKIVYDESKETTARVLAAEMIVRFVPNPLASVELIKRLPSFENNELATMIYSRMQSLKPDSLPKHHENWYWKSCIINGSSTSFVRTMAKTDSLNASYGVNVENLNQGKIFKGSSFDVFLDTPQRTQDLFSLDIFAREVKSVAAFGSSSQGETPMAGMTLKLLGGYLRPIVFFTGSGELMMHIWHGTVSEPTTAFNGNLLLIDHSEGYPLISGFVAEQQMRGLLSIDVSGTAKVSLWYKNCHSVVRTKASVIAQASQSVYTSFDNFWQSHLFSFGGQASMDFVVDAKFMSFPLRTCLQITQPEFIVRYNSRRHDQMMTNEVRRKITRRNYSIGAKSYSLNTENNKMCSSMLEYDELEL